MGENIVTTIQVAENKADRIRRYISVFPLLKSVNKVILFGSAMTEQCTEQSDVDLCFLYRDKKKYREGETAKMKRRQ